MVSNMTAIKTTILVDEKTWNEFRRSVSRRYGSPRMASQAVEEAIRSFNSFELLKRFSEAAGLITSTYPSVKEIQERRPKLGTSAGEEVRRMRDERQARLSRLE